MLTDFRVPPFTDLLTKCEDYTSSGTTVAADDFFETLQIIQYK